ncbi:MULTISPECIES: ATP-binding protein [Nocardia]|uniref:ATP-binding protein n=1 Tax=Nocardia TaxID=1817 RepID=UPI0002F22122|nr:MULTISPECIES: ATP-binding protein [Nocardia]
MPAIPARHDAVAWSVTVRGLTGHLRQVTAEVTPGLPSLTVTGPGEDRPPACIDRVHAALTGAGWAWPRIRLTLTTSPPVPAGIDGIHDLAVAAAILAASDPATVSAPRLAGVVLLGQLGPDGSVVSVRGILPAVLAARDHGHTVVIVPHANLAEAALAPGITVLGAVHLRGVLAWLGGDKDAVTGPAAVPAPPESTGVDLGDIRGHYRTRWALEVAAAGGHHVRLIGPAEAGLGALARRLPGLLPRLTESESLEVRAIASLTGTLPEGPLPAIAARPFVDVHHSASARALLGSAGFARPGALARAHHGVLHLESYPDLHERALDALRTSLEAGEVVVANRDNLLRLPCEALAVLTSSECFCPATHQGACACPAGARRGHQDRLRRVLADRVDITVRENPDDRAGFGNDSRETSAEVRHRVTAARTAAAHRWREHGHTLNARIPASLLRQQFPLSPTESAPLEAALREGRITRHGGDRVLAVAVTIADLRGADHPSTHDLVEALHLHGFGRP